MSSKKVVVWWELHPSSDHVVPVVVAVLACLKLADSFTAEVTRGLLNAAITFGGVALTACAFAATMIYTSSDRYVQEIRRNSRTSLARNWMSILRTLSISSAMAGLSLVFVEHCSHHLGALAIYFIVISLLRVLRGLYFLKRIFIIDGMENSR